MMTEKRIFVNRVTKQYSGRGSQLFILISFSGNLVKNVVVTSNLNKYTY
jgi:hypothetical protein